MTLFTFSRESPSPQHHACSSSSLGPLSLSLSLSFSPISRFLSMEDLKDSLACLGLYFVCRQQHVDGSMPLCSVCSKHSTLTLTQVHVHTGQCRLTDTGPCTGHATEMPSEQSMIFPNPCKPCLLAACGSVDFREAIGSASPACTVCAAPAEGSPGLHNDEPVMFLLVFGLQVIKNYRRV